MKNVCEKILVNQSTENQFIAYSPLTNQRIKINSLMKELIVYLQANQSNRKTLDDLQAHIEKKSGLTINHSTLTSAIKSLFDAKFFHQNKQELIQLQNFKRGQYLDNKRAVLEKGFNTAYLHLTHRCNLNCYYCYNRDFRKTHKNELTTQEWIQIIQTLKNIGVKEIILTGGEPLLRDDIIEILESCKPMRTVLLTNGELLVPKAHELLPLLDSVIISLDSLESATNYKNRENSDQNNIENTIKVCAAIDSSKITIRSVITKNNLEQQKTFKQDIKKRYGVECSQIIFLPNSKHDLNEIPSVESISQIICNGECHQNSSFATAVCGAASNILAISADGGIYPCQNLMFDQFKITNIKTPNWEKLLYSNKTRTKFSNLDFHKDKECKQCQVRYICGGGCPANSFKVFNKLEKSIPELCAHYKHNAIELIKNKPFKGLYCEN